MELKKITPRILTLFALAIILGGCETHLNSEPLEIIGTPPEEMFYDSEFSYQFGLRGGDGLYSIRYIANPDSESTGPSVSENPVELTVEKINSTKPGFWLRGVPRSEGNIAVADRELTYALEVSDGASTIRREFTFTLRTNTLILNSTSTVSREQQGNDSAARQLVNSKQLGATNVCRQGVDRTFNPTMLNGQWIYPQVIGVRLNAIPVHRVEVGYRFASTYADNFGEVDAINLAKARPNVDYLDEVRTLVFEPGESRCVVYLNVLDDNLVEGVERLEVHFFDRSGALVDIAGVIGNISIADNEPRPRYSSQKITANQGDTVVSEFSIADPYSFPIDILVGIDTDKTTAEADDFLLQPLSRRVTIPAGDTTASYSVTLLQNDDTGEAQDDVVVINTSLDELLREPPFEVAINNWTLDKEVIARESEGLDVVDFVHAEGLIAVLGKKGSGAGEDLFELAVYQSNGVKKGPSVEFSQQGVNVSPVAIAMDENAKVLVAANVDGMLSGLPHYGSSDFIVTSYVENAEGDYQLKQSAQFGTSGEDVATGLALDTSGNLYVYGRTDGTAFENNSSAGLNRGGTDGFVYRINEPDEFMKVWSKFVGTENDDVVVSANISRTNLVVLSNTQNTDSDVFLNVLGLDGETKSFLADSQTGIARTQVDVASPRHDIGRGVAFMGIGTSFAAMVNSDADLPGFERTPSLSTDGFLLFYDTEAGVSAGSIKFATGLEDQLAAMQVLNEEGALAVGGMTKGQFEGQVRKGTGNDDAFVGIVDAGGTGQTSLSKVSQFGTLSDDELISIKRVSDHKFMVLWSETSTSGDGTKVYRLSPFSIDGIKLTPDP